MINSPQVTITGHTQISNGLNVDAGTSSDCATFTGTIKTTVDVIADGKSLVHHVHGNVTTGASQTGQPV
ncbi:hypothetical protein LIN78_01890 [Leeia sp. TBRC 13508]|uniref:Uncharacterized protein n=1 Tax=Leeia speluncae TaxID=2884804 RepID=A0ABS8D2U4_9NEIS|nr:hypothetical protein [Leeia speluncae]MCB6182306.1 hypothetical protein [Leeia speluncae]